MVLCLTWPVGLRPPSLSVRGKVLKGRALGCRGFRGPSLTGRTGRTGARMLGPERGLLSRGDWGLPSPRPV